jgi:hypothetical protein
MAGTLNNEQLSKLTQYHGGVFQLVRSDVSYCEETF